MMLLRWWLGLGALVLVACSHRVDTAASVEAEARASTTTTEHVEEAARVVETAKVAKAIPVRRVVVRERLLPPLSSISPPPAVDPGETYPGGWPPVALAPEWAAPVVVERETETTDYAPAADETAKTTETAKVDDTQQKRDEEARLRAAEEEHRRTEARLFSIGGAGLALLAGGLFLARKALGAWLRRVFP